MTNLTKQLLFITGLLLIFLTGVAFLIGGKPFMVMAATSAAVVVGGLTVSGLAIIAQKIWPV